MRSNLVARLLVLAVVLVGAILPAQACPPGSRFSAGNGNGICVVIGQGLRAAATCSVARGACPAGTSREHSNNDPTRDYCCPAQATLALKPHGNCFWSGTAPFCNGKCPAGFQAKKGRDGKACLTGSKLYCCPPD